jgi:hypothetical protein
VAPSVEAKDQARLEDQVGHPQVKFDALCSRIQDQALTTFKGVEDDFLDLLWTLDTYRSSNVVPRGMGDPDSDPGPRLDAVYRGKGNYFSTAMTLILGNKTTSVLAARSGVLGFSQAHQIDIAWPARDFTPIVDPLVCAEAKLTGAPPYPGSRNGRGAMSDWSNRRKELKFQAADLKLSRNSVDTQIDNWDLWRRDAPPAVYSLWAARLRPKDDVEKMVREARLLTTTYCDGVGIYAFRTNQQQTGYEPTELAKGVDSRVTSLDSVLELIAATIRKIVKANGGVVPGPKNPAS